MPKKLILFPGQGSLKIEVIKKMYIDSIEFKRNIDMVSDFAECNLSHKLQSGDVDNILTKSYLIFAASLGTFYQYIKPMDLDKAIFLGHSIGEIAALTCADGLEILDSIKIIKRRIELSSIPNTGMYVVTNIDSNYVYDICSELRREGKRVWVSCDNNDLQCCIAGDSWALKCAAQLLETIGAKVIKLQSNLPYHCDILKGKDKELKAFIEKLKIKPLQHIVISNVFSLPYQSYKEIPNNLGLQLSHPVRWKQIMDYIESQAYQESYEMAFSDILTKIASKKLHSWKTVKYCI